METNIIQLSAGSKPIFKVPYEVIPFFIGAYGGYKNSHGIEFGLLEKAALYGLPIVAGTVASSAGLLVLGQIGKKQMPQLEEKLSNEHILKSTMKSMLRSGIAEAIGYSVGYFVGSLKK